jgi:hypothetical protein
LGGGLVEFMVIGTAIKKMDGMATRNTVLPPQAIIQDHETFVDTTRGESSRLSETKAASARVTQVGPLMIILMVLLTAVFIIWYCQSRHFGLLGTIFALLYMAIAGYFKLTGQRTRY